MEQRPIDQLIAARIAEEAPDWTESRAKTVSDEEATMAKIGHRKQR
jgi:hypothetical protein